MNTRETWDSAYHAPVLAAEIIELLRGRRLVVDGTLGGGGHSLALLRDGGVDRVVGVDRDPVAIATARERLAEYVNAGRFETVQSNYADVAAHDALSDDPPDGVLLDLGISSHQIDADDRGFTFREGARLDMRMDPEAPLDAAEWLNDAGDQELARAFREYGDEPKAARLAREVVRRRERRPFETSDDLVGAIRATLGPRSGPSEFARLFQAVRIAVNDELSGLERALPSLRDRLAPGGVMAVIAYHSGEDRLVKNAFRDWSAACVCPPKQVVCTCRGRPLGTTITRKPVLAGEDEIARNPRARSARLRAWRSGE
jgi:16S rRNA (cytosine1402-N4)-methyltransferase